MKTTEEKNRLIAEFMEVNVNSNGTFELPQFGSIRPNGDFKTEFNDTQLKYHTSWDWLMPVVEKVSKFTDEQVIMNVDKKHNRSECLMYYGGRFHPHISNEKLINNTYNAIVQFIEWYNENKKL